MKQKFISVVSAVLFVLAGCSDFLDEELKGSYTTESFYQTEQHAQLALTGVYNIASFVSSRNALWVFGDVASDDAIKGGNPGDQSDVEFIDQFTYSRNNGMLENVWVHYYEGITRANYLLYYGSDIDMDVALRTRILAEAKFLRAYFYFNLVNIFGEIPLKLNPPLNPDFIHIGTSPVAVVYTQIEKDLMEAKAVLPKNYLGQATTGRATKGAAWGMLAKARLYQGNWAGALTAIDSLEALNLYKLEQVYKNNFIDSTQNNDESIFEIQHISGQDPKQGSFLNQYFMTAKDGGYFFDAPVEDFVQEFEVTAGGVVDPRLDYTVGREGEPWINGETFNPEWSPTGFLQRKHLQPLSEQKIVGDGALNYVYLRYADILLMKAEALNELSQVANALVPLNAVRKRARESYLYDAGLPGSGSVPADLLPDVVSVNQSDVREAIRHERRVELGFEFHRFFDLMRYGQVAAEAALSETNFTYSANRYFLIPQSEVDLNTAIDE